MATYKPREWWDKFNSLNEDQKRIFLAHVLGGAKAYENIIGFEEQSLFNMAYDEAKGWGK